MGKVGNALKATTIVFGAIVAIGIVALLIAIGKMAKGVALMLLGIIAPVLLIALAIYVVYRILEAK